LSRTVQGVYPKEPEFQNSDELRPSI
jgi:hypothetical protein